MLLQNRSHGLDSLDILQSRRLLSDGLSYTEMSLQLAGNEKSLFLALGMYMLHAYTMLNLRVNFQDQILIPINQIEQYTCPICPLIQDLPIMKIQQSPISKYYFAEALMVNIHTCLDANQNASYFNCLPPSLEDYLR